MSEPRIISPLLDGFALGESINCHSGVNCYPAMREDSDERYIVKTISIPASQTQLDALLLTGAFADEEAARSYFKELTQGLRNEVSVLEKLAQRQGYLPFLGYQVVPLAEGVGFEFYLVSHYRRTLARFLRRNSMTHLSAVNMGIDLCAALGIAREEGYLYVGLKPSNIFLGGEQEFFIGDLGFISMDALNYTSLPERCRSFYTPPEVADAYAALNTTMDTYALGLILYQVYNDGKLPFDSEEGRKELMAKLAAGESLPAPAYADYEMAQIILKACAYDPAERWADPSEMGQALITYMQRNGANNTLITVPTPIPVEEEAAPVAEPVVEEAAGPETAEVPESVEEAEAEAPAGDWVDRMDALLSGDKAETADSDSEALRRILREEDGEAEELTEGEMTDEMAGILSQAEELIAHEAPEPVVAPEPIEIPMPEPIVIEEAPEAAEEEAEPEAEAVEAFDDEEEEKEEDRRERRGSGIGKAVLRWVIILAVLSALAVGIYYGYSEYYLQEVSALNVEGQKDTMTVQVVTELDESKLTVVCMDLYGNKKTSALSGGSATFTGLTAGTQYNITLEVEGLHKLTGKTTAQHYTLPVATISELTAVTGPDDGSVVLTFVSEGPAVKSWTLEYGAEGEVPVETTFTGNTVIINALVPGTQYTFTLKSTDQVELEGVTETAYTASKVVLAQNLTVLSNNGGTISVGWAVPEGATVSEWTARCYNDAGYDQLVTVTEPTASFTGIDPTVSYTVEITAAGMTQIARTYVTSNPITVTSLQAAEFAGSSISMTWEYEGTTPESGWLVLYTVDGSTEQHVIQTDTTVAIIEPIAPGSRYDIVIQAANVTVFGGSTSVEVKKPGTFGNYGLRADQIGTTLCKLPSDTWTYRDITDAERVNTFAAGDKVGVMLLTTATYNIDYNDVVTTFVVRDAEGRLACISTSTDTWDDMWLAGHCDLSVPTMPTATGSYTLDIFFDGDLVSTLPFTIA